MSIFYMIRERHSIRRVKNKYRLAIWFNSYRMEKPRIGGGGACIYFDGDLKSLISYTLHYPPSPDFKTDDYDKAQARLEEIARKHVLLIEKLSPNSPRLMRQAGLL